MTQYPKPTTLTLKMDRSVKFAQLRERLLKTEAENKEALIEENTKKNQNQKEIHKALRKREQAERLLEEHLAKEQGVDYERQKNLTYTAEEVEQWEKRQKKKAKNVNNGFVSYDEANLKKYRKLTEQITPDLARYEETKQKMSVEGRLGADVQADTIDYINPVDHKPTEEDANRLTNDLKKQLEVRQKHSRRRAEDPEADISYINDKNMRFNKKISRAYDKYTAEIKDNFERGTAL